MTPFLTRAENGMRFRTNLTTLLFLLAMSRAAVAGPFEDQWVVDALPFGSVDELRAQQALSTSDVAATEYFPKLSVVCDRGAIGPYGSSRAEYQALRVEVRWQALHLPKDFAPLETFLRTGIDPRAVDNRGNTIWVNFGRARTANGGFSDLITIGDDNSSPVETVKISGTSKGFSFSAELLDSGLAEAFVRAWNPFGGIPVVLQDANGHDLKRTVELRGMKPAVNKVLARCGREHL
jgi:hypothetical protein